MTVLETAPVTRARVLLEVGLVLGVSLGRSAVYSILSFADTATRGVALNQQTTTMNSSVTPDRPWLDLAYQLAGLVFPLVPVALALYLLHLSQPGVRQFIGFDLARPRQDLIRGLLVAAGIGIPGLGLYLAARALGVNTNIAAANLTEQWWTIPVLIGAAVMNGVLEEVLMLGYLFVRLGQLGWQPWVIVAASAVLRGSYHLYQGLGGFAGNIVMGLVFGLLYLRWRRVMPLVNAHVALDVAAFIGYAALAGRVSWL